MGAKTLVFHLSARRESPASELSCGRGKASIRCGVRVRLVSELWLCQRPFLRKLADKGGISGDTTTLESMGAIERLAAELIYKLVRSHQFIEFSRLPAYQ